MGDKMTTVQAVKTTDGKLYDVPQEGQRHQIDLDLADYLDKEVNGSPDRKAIIEFITTNRFDLKDILNGTHTTSRV